MSNRIRSRLQKTAMQGYNKGIEEANLLTQIWVKPNTTLAYILRHCPDQYVPALLCLGGIVRAIDRASVQNTGDKMSTASVLLLAVIAGGLFGWLTYYIYAWAMSATGTWLKGNASTAKFRTVLAWALIPSICSLLLLIPQVIIFGNDLFKSEPAVTSNFHSLMWTIFGIIEITLSAWSLVILVKGISLIQNFTTGKSILNMLLPGTLLVGFILTIVLIFRLLA